MRFGRGRWTRRPKRDAHRVPREAGATAPIVHVDPLFARMSRIGVPADSTRTKRLTTNSHNRGCTMTVKRLVSGLLALSIVLAALPARAETEGGSSAAAQGSASS